MAQPDEARYGRMSLLVLNICPATIRCAIEQDYSRQGYADFADFLESKKHQIFHLMYRRCCCRPALSTSTPFNRSQWDLLFTRCTTALPHRHQGECPCQYTAIPGISCDVMDVTLCCLVVRNLCHGINLADVDTICKARNKLIHSDTGASLDEPSFNAAWGSVEGAVLSLARSISPSLEADTKTSLQELRDRIMNPSDLLALKSLIVDEKKVDQLAQITAQHSEQLTSQQQEIRALQAAQRNPPQHSDDYPGTSTMAQPDEARYGRMSLLVLNICPATIICAIEKDYSRQGYADFGDFLESKKHQIFHLMYRRCCCRPAPSTSTPLNRSQWNLLFTRCATALPHRHQGECPCQYTAIPGISCDVMDITLCCLVVRNLCPGINLADVCTIREARNKLIHSDTGASLDEPSFNAAWGSVERAVLSLAGSVSQSLEADTKIRLQELKDRIMNPSDLLALKSLIVDEKKVDQLAQITAQHSEQLASQQQELTSQQQEIRALQAAQRNPPQHSDDYPEEKVDKLREELLKYNHRATQNIQVSPLEKLSKRLSIDQLYAPVVIRQDLEQKHRTHRHKPRRPDDRDQTEPTRKDVNSPDDMFYKDGEPVRFVFMQGEAAHGKTTYCLQLLRYWCIAKQPSKKKFSSWEKSLNLYAFVFLLRLRLVDKSRSSLLDMVCYDTLRYSTDCSETIRHVLCSGKYQSLIIVDGLDEWKSSAEARKNLTHEGLPNMKELQELPGCTTLISFRPWKFATLASLMEHPHRVVEIEGLHKDGVEKVIRNVLVNYYGLKEGSGELQRRYDEIREETKGENVKQIVHIPLLLVASIILLYRNEKVGNSKTTFYMAMITMLIEQTFDNKLLDHSLGQTFSKLELSDINPPPLIQSEDTLNEFFVVLFKLGEIAHQDLMSDETSLVFGKRKLAKKLGEAELEYALKVGLLSQCEAPSSYTKQVSVNFLHKSIQELHAAIYISSRNEVIDIFCKHLSSIKVIMELSNVIMFTSQLSPSLGSVLSQQIVRVANTDPDMCRCRDTFDHTRNKVRLLYNLQVSCYREMQQGLSMSNSTEPLTYHVSDVYLDYDSNRDTVRTSVDLMCNNPTHIVSLYLYLVPGDGDDGITDRELTQILDNTTSLQYLCIWDRTIFTVSDRFTSLKTLHLHYVRVTRDALCGLQRCLQHNTVLQSLTLVNITCQDNASLRGVLLCLPNSPCLSTLHIGWLCNTEDTQTLVDVLPRIKCLRSIQYVGTYPLHPAPAAAADAAVVHTVSCMKQLQHVHLEDITLGDRSLELTSEMSQIEKVELRRVKMSAGGWNKFVHSLINIPHHFDVILDDTDIDDESVTMIRSSPYFTVTKDESVTMIRFSPYFTVTNDVCRSWTGQDGRVTPSTQHPDVVYHITNVTTNNLTEDVDRS